MGKAVHAFESYGIEAAIWNRDDRNRRPAGRRRTGDEIPPAIEKNGIGGREAEHYRRHDSVVSRLDSAQLGHAVAGASGIIARGLDCTSDAPVNGYVSEVG